MAQAPHDHHDGSPSEAVPSATARPADIVAAFVAAWGQAQGEAADNVELVPARLVRAVQEVLPADGVGLSLFDHGFRVPIASTGESASTAEQLQFTLGEGPCLASAETGFTFALDEDRLQEQWPLYAHELAAHTEYRAIVTLPLPLGDGATGALDLYFVDPDRLRDVSVADTSAIIELIARVLAMSHPDADAIDTGETIDEAPSWLNTPSARERRRVWVASGILIASLEVSADDAIALMRSHAYSSDSTLDEIADQLIEGVLEPADFQP